MNEACDAICVHNLCFRYAESERCVLNGIDLRIAMGETVLLLGPSGSGKSSLALALTGLIPQRIPGDMTGEVIIAGHNSATTPLATLCTQAGIVMQDPASQMVMPRVDEEIAFGLENLGLARNEMEQRIEIILAQTGLTALRRAWIDLLSSGQQQRVALTAVLALSPKILILDEPTASLDPAGATAFFEVLHAWQSATGATVVIIEHRLDLVLPLVDRVVVLNRQGELLGEGAPHSFFHTHATQLAVEGIWLPATVRLRLALGQQGQVLPPLPLDVDNAAGVLQAVALNPVLLPPGSQTLSQPPLIHLEQLRFRYGNGPEVLHGIDLQVSQGDFLALVGSNGSGKSTLASHLVGLFTPQSGKCQILGQRITPRNAPTLPQQVGYVFQNPEHQFVAEQVADEIAFSMRGRWHDDEVQRRVDYLLAQFNLAAYAEANPFTLSWGQKRRLSVATMVALDQPILILDEPTLGQDRQNVDTLMALLQQLNQQGTTIILITHDMELVADVARTVAVLHQGELLYHGTVRDLFTQHSFTQHSFTQHNFTQHSVLAVAQLELPPLARLGHHLRRNDLLTVADWVAAMAG
jgi:energy-coupling factor transport system ATP-binding protein